MGYEGLLPPEAFEDAERDDASRAHAPWLASLETDPAFDPIRRDERFARLVAKLRVPYRKS